MNPHILILRRIRFSTKMDVELLLFARMGREANAYYEFLDATQGLGVEVLRAVKTHSPGILLVGAKFSGNPVTTLKEAFYKRYWVLRSLLKVSVAYSVVDADDEKGILELSERLNVWVDSSKYRVTLHRVKSPEMRRRIIGLVASKITAPVDLEDYAREIIVYYVDSKLYFVLGRTSEILVERLDAAMET